MSGVESIFGPVVAPEADAAEERFCVELTGKSRGADKGDVLQVSEDRAFELVTAGLAKHI